MSQEDKDEDKQDIDAINEEIGHGNPASRLIEAIEEQKAKKKKEQSGS